MKNFNKTSLTIVILTISCLKLEAQTNWAWARDFGQSQTAVYNIAINQNDDVVVFGQTSGIQIIDGIVFNNVPFLSTLNSDNGNMISAGLNGITPYCNTCKIIYTDAGDYYLKENLKVQKFNSQNIKQWDGIFTMTGDQKGELVDFAVDANGNSFILAWFDSYSVSYNGISIIGSGQGSGIFLFKIDAFGFYVWNKKISDYGSPAPTRPGEVIVGGNNVFVSYSDKSSPGDIDTLFLLKINQGAQIIAISKIWGGVNITESYLDVDTNNDIYLSANFTNSIQFFQAWALIGQGQTDYFIAKFGNNLGAPVWITHCGSASNESVVGLAYSKNFVVVGNYEGHTQTLPNCPIPGGNGTLLIRSLNSNNGTCAAYERVLSSSNDYLDKIIADDQGNFYLTGTIQSVATFGTIIVGQGNPNGGPFIAKYNPDGVIGTIENKSTDNFSVYPNPTSGKLLLSSYPHELSAIEITDANGRTKFRTYITQAGEIDISNLENGLYFIKVNSGKNVTVTKIVLQK